MYRVIDLFAGAGGLSLGFIQTGKYKIVAAFEINKNAQKTYKKNHAETKIYSDVCSANFREVENEVGNIDVIIGGPPCQGFSNANRQKNHAVSLNNVLVKQYVRAVLEIQPKAFVMENVGMLKSDVHRFYLRNDEKDIIAEHEIKTLLSEIILIEEQYYSDKLAEDIADIARIDEMLWTETDYRLLNVIYRQRNNIPKCRITLKKYKKLLLKLTKRILECNYKGEYDCFNDAANSLVSYYDGEISEQDIILHIEKTIMIQRCFSKAKELYDNNLKIEDFDCKHGIVAKIQSYSVLDYLTKMLEKDYSFTKGILNAVNFGAPQKRNRFILIGIKKEITDNFDIPIDMPKVKFTEEAYRTVKDAIRDLENVSTHYEVKKDKGVVLNNEYEETSLTPYLRDSKILYNHIITQTREIAMKRFEAIAPGENFHSLDASLKENTYTDVSRTQNTIYQRLNYDTPSGTVLNVRKSMWIHPTLNRAVSIREAARLQTFPDSFVFCGTKDSQYQQVGNAVPPILAKAVAEHLAKYLDGEFDG